MAQNPLLGNKISLISKKNIRYEGILYSINETNSTLALQNVTSFGTEGREKAEPSTAFVAPQEGVHAYLLFRGCDIKDLHVHEQQHDPAASPTAVTEKGSPPAVASTPEVVATPETTEKPEKTKDAKDDNDLPPPPTVPVTSTAPVTKKENQSNGNAKKERATSNSNSQRRSNPRRNTPAVGTGASLLNRKARGAVQGGPGPEKPEGDFDFQAKLEEFDKGVDGAQKEAKNEEDNDEAGDEIAHPQHNESSATTHYDKDDFFDSISCDALDKKSGVDNRLRGKEERSLNTETFGATALTLNEDAVDVEVGVEVTTDEVADAVATEVEAGDAVEEEVEEVDTETTTTVDSTHHKGQILVVIATKRVLQCNLHQLLRNGLEQAVLDQLD
eukprot:CAMPEP_0201135440 /NCGR_PEP_ID=MMETSP0850-20130426/54315_1 /ASSEMBLY_ACC=CAM_ASM_000622 /TAXON_ID=183588 /ORGANISM="Pseudo-nitzschia fraudulenta, Strain WWA7" /LENGTH=386 /DNA_ID=CAMNT_0047406603 /DNA_START=39 /DNA_END=1200 /DNA_ORIENTATION=+